MQVHRCALGVQAQQVSAPGLLAGGGGGDELRMGMKVGRWGLWGVWPEPWLRMKGCS